MHRIIWPVATASVVEPEVFAGGKVGARYVIVTPVISALTNTGGAGEGLRFS